MGLQTRQVYLLRKWIKSLPFSQMPSLVFNPSLILQYALAIFLKLVQFCYAVPMVIVYRINHFHCPLYC